MLQCSPSQPGWQMQVPSWHWPCSSQRGWHALWSHAAPIQPSSHWHWPSEQTPWLPHGTRHSSVEQVGRDTREGGKKHVSVRGREEREGGEQMEQPSAARKTKLKEAQGTQEREKNKFKNQNWGKPLYIGERIKQKDERVSGINSDEKNTTFSQYTICPPLIAQLP